MHKLLVPVDGSENSDRAVNYAIDRAREGGPVVIHLVTVHPEPVLHGEIEVYISRDKFEELQKKRSEAMIQPAVDLVKAAGVPFTSEILIGETAHAIAQSCEDHRCDGIVMGTRGMGPVGNLVMGSVATKVIHLAKVPVTLIK